MEWWKSLFRKRALDAQLDSELRFHIEELTEANVAAGLTPEEARRRAVLEFGGREQVKEELRDVHRVSIIESTLANLKSAFRFIRKSPSFSTTVIVTLALGIGANSAVFSAIDAILLRPLPFPNGDQLMELRQYNPKTSSPRTRLAPVRLEDWNRMNSTFQAITGYYTEDNSETSGALPEKVTQAFVTPRFLQVWGISPALGRDWTPQAGRNAGASARKPGDGAKATWQGISKNRCGLERGNRTTQGNDDWRCAEIALDLVRFRFSSPSDCLHKHHCAAACTRHA